MTPLAFSSTTPASLVALLRLFLLVAAINPAVGTYSITAFNRTSGAVGCAITSCVGDINALAVCRAAAGRGVVAAQASPSSKARDKALKLLKSGNLTAGEIVTKITSPAFDLGASVRQYGVCGASGCATFTGYWPANCYDRSSYYSSCFSGSKIVNKAGSDTHSSYQGNVLTSEMVLLQAASGFEEGLPDDKTHGRSLAARLMAALAAAKENNEGDVRCRDSKGTASDSAALMVLGPAGGAERNTILKVKGTGKKEAVDELMAKFERCLVDPCACEEAVPSFSPAKRCVQLTGSIEFKLVKIGSKIKNLIAEHEALAVVKTLDSALRLLLISEKIEKKVKAEFQSFSILYSKMTYNKNKKLLTFHCTVTIKYFEQPKVSKLQKAVKRILKEDVVKTLQDQFGSQGYFQNLKKITTKLNLE